MSLEMLPVKIGIDDLLFWTILMHGLPKFFAVRFQLVENSSSELIPPRYGAYISPHALAVRHPV